MGSYGTYGQKLLLRYSVDGYVGLSKVWYALCVRGGSQFHWFGILWFIYNSEIFSPFVLKEWGRYGQKAMI